MFTPPPTDLDWVIVRPGTLTDAAGTGLVRIGPAIPYGEVPRDDVAAVLTELVHQPQISRKIVELTALTACAPCTTSATAAWPNGLFLDGEEENLDERSRIYQRMVRDVLTPNGLSSSDSATQANRRRGDVRGDARARPENSAGGLSPRRRAQRASWLDDGEDLDDRSHAYRRTLRERSTVSEAIRRLHDRGETPDESCTRHPRARPRSSLSVLRARASPPLPLRTTRGSRWTPPSGPSGAAVTAAPAAPAGPPKSPRIQRLDLLLVLLVDRLALQLHRGRQFVASGLPV